MVTIKVALACVLVLVLACVFQIPQARATDKNPAIIKLAMLHLNLEYAALEANHALLEQATRIAAAQGAQWVITPELALTGYRFDMTLGTDWILPGADTHVTRLQALADELDVVLFLSHLEKSEKDGNRYNTLFIIDRSGEIIGKHQKINTIPVSEDWSTPGSTTDPVNVDGHRVGLLICADAWPKQHAASLKHKGAQLLVSSASWAPGEYGPRDTWEKRSAETQLPLFVTNRTGVERGIDLSNAQSAVSASGQRLLTHTSGVSTVLLIDWNQTEQRIESEKVVRVDAATK